MDIKLKQINRQFYRYWMKESREWRKNYFHVQRVFYRLNKISNKTGMRISEIIKNLLTSREDLFFGENYENIKKRIGCNIKESEIKDILEVAGYEYKKIGEESYLVEGRREQVLNACFATEIWISSSDVHGIKDRINCLKQDLYYKKYRKYEAKLDEMALYHSSNAFKKEAANGERINLYSSFASRILLLVVIIGFVILCLYVKDVYSNPQKYGENATNFWNTLLAAGIPCLVTILTTYMLVQHEYRVDFHRERTSVLPIFSFKLIDKNSLLEGKELKSEFKDIFINTAENDNLKSEELEIYRLSNIGYGIGFNVRHDRGDDLFTFGDISQNGSCYIAIKKMDSLYYLIEYDDIYGNKYTQFFDVVKNNGKCNVMSFSPELVLRTKRVRYQQ